jgi:hypothetical protein
MYHFNVGTRSSDIQRFVFQIIHVHPFISCHNIKRGVYDMWLMKVQRISHCKNSNLYAVINNCVYISALRIFRFI